MKVLTRLFFIIIMIFTSLCASAQTKGDKLFQEGQTLQKTLTIASQNSAIKKFQAAKIAYTTSEKKKICDNQIVICGNNIKQLKKATVKTSSTTKTTTTTKEEEKVEPEEPKPVYHEDLTLSLSESRLDFKANPKPGATQSVEVRCNYDGWFVAKKPDWVTVYVTVGKFSVEVQENTTESDRSGVITIGCENKEADIVVNQAKLKGIGKIMKNVKKNIGGK